jgi:hypothetical protein
MWSDALNGFVACASRIHLLQLKREECGSSSKNGEEEKRN